MLNKEIAKKELDKKEILSGELSPTIEQIVELVGDEAPLDMARIIALFVSSSFINHLQVKMLELYKEEYVKPPMNVVAFILAKSGAKKTSTISAMESAFKIGYNKIEEIRDRIIENKKKEADDPSKIKKRELKTAVSTVEGLATLMNHFKKEGIGAPSIIIDEIATALKPKSDTIDNIDFVAQMYDYGNFLGKAIKDQERQTESVKEMPLSALFIGSEYGILMDEQKLDIFNEEFMSKLARRSWFCYPSFKKEEKEIMDFEEYKRRIEERDKKIAKIRNEIRLKSGRIVDRFIMEDEPLQKLSDEVYDVILAYESYCSRRAEELKLEQEALEMEHRPWKVLKVAGMLSVLDEAKKLEVKHYRWAVSYAEMLNGHLRKFLEASGRTPAEKLVAIFEEKKEIQIHELLKRKIIKSPKLVEETVNLANSIIAGKQLEIQGSLVIEKPLIKTELFGASTTFVPDLKSYMEEKKLDKKKAKEEIAQLYTRDGFQYNRGTFEQLEALLCNNMAYVAFRLRDGKRGLDYLMGTAQFVVLDVDNAGITIDEAADMLQDYNFLMAKTSDKDNPFKFRILLPSDVEIDISDVAWTTLLALIEEDIGIELDKTVGKAQFFYGYKGREVLKNVDANYYQISKLIPKLANVTELKEHEIRNPMTEKQQKSFMLNRRKILHAAYEAQHGEPLELFKAMLHMARLGVPYNINKEVCEEIAQIYGGRLRRGFLKNLERQRYRWYKKLNRIEETKNEELM